MTRALDDTHDSSLRSWVQSANVAGAEFPIQNLPLGVFVRRGGTERPRIGVAIGRDILDMGLAREGMLLESLPVEIREALNRPTLNALMALGGDSMSMLRKRLVAILRSGSKAADMPILVPIAEASLLVPAAIGDYTDFYASIHHATRVGRLFRPDNPLLPNYRYVPIAYHGRASSIVASGTPVRRPAGQRKRPDDAAPSFGPSRSLDYEREVGVFIGRGNALGEPIAVTDAEDHIFGLCLLNDWSARDIQSWESQPLGPFLAKNFATTVSPWVVTMEALAPFRREAAPRAVGDPEPLPYLADHKGPIDLRVEASLATARMREQGAAAHALGTAALCDLYWNLAQMVAHHTSNGCNLRPGDLLGTGTISGADDNERGCLMEITSNGREPLLLPNGETRTFLADGDEVILRGYCDREGFVRIGFGECQGIVSG